MVGVQKRKIRWAISLFLVMLYFTGLSAQAQYGGGSGEPNDPYLIYTAEQMNAIGADANDWVKHFKLIADIDLSGYTGTDFNIIGNFVDRGDYEPFNGVFDGNDHTIRNFTYTSTGTNYIGLFGCVGGGNAEIKDLTLINPNVDGGTGVYVGSLVGNLSGSITSCYAKGGSVSGNYLVGGLIGIIGGLGDTVINCYATCSVSGNESIGGLVGFNNGNIFRCYSAGSVTGNNIVGGLVGENLAGFLGAATIFNCYSTASVSGNDCVGGLVGANVQSAVISKCYSYGRVSGTAYVGGLVGSNDNWAPDSFWDIQTSEQATSAGGTGKTTTEMQIESTFTDAGWDLVSESVNGTEDIWRILEGQDYPRLWWEKYGGGSGEPNDPYLIYTAEQMNTIGTEPNDWDKHFILINDIDLSAYNGTQFNIIGRYFGWNHPDNKAFNGVFDGNGHTISNFSYASTEADNIGLFGYVRGENVEIKNLGLIDPNIDAGTGSDVGSLVGELWNGTVTGCYAEGGSISGNWFVGGLVGSNYGTITNCYSTGTVSGNSNVGGLVGSSEYGGRIINCYTNCNVTGGDYVGGLAGGIGGEVYIPLVVPNIITNCYSIGGVSGRNLVGGLVGFFYEGIITMSYSTGAVTGVDCVGGLVGVCWGTISNSYANGSVSGTNNVGGLVGWNDNEWGSNLGVTTTSFWDIETSGQTTSDGGTGLTTAEMQMASTFLEAGWDFVGESVNGTEDIWSICEGTNYPRLVWQIPAGDFVCPDGITIEDFVFFIEYWRDDNCDLSNDYCQGTDLDFSGTVDEADLEILVENWLAGVRSD